MIILLCLGIFFCCRPLPTLLLPQQRSRRSLQDVLEVFVDQARSGMPTPVAMQTALDVSFLVDQKCARYLAERFAHDPLAPHFALMWQGLYRRGAGIVDGADCVAAIARHQHAQEQELAAKSSGARSTFRLLVLLPIWFLLIGQLVGIPALSVLVTHIWGYLLLGLSGLLMWAGHRWMKRILASL